MGKITDLKEYHRQYYQANKERFRERAREWRKANPEKVKEVNHQQYLRRKALKQQKEADTVRPEITD